MFVGQIQSACFIKTLRPEFFLVEESTPALVVKFPKVPFHGLPLASIFVHLMASPIGFSSAVAAATAVGGLTSSPSAAPKIHAAARQRLFAQNAGGAVCMIDCYGVKFHHATAGTHSFQMAENTRHMSTPENRTHFTAKAFSHGAIRNPSLYVCELFGAYSKASNQ